MRQLAYWITLPFLLVAYGVILPIGDGLINSLIRLFGFPAVLVWLWSLAETGKIRRLHAFHWAALVFFAWNVVSIGWTVDVVGTLWQLSRYLPMIFASIMLWDIYRTRGAYEAGLQAIVIGSYVGIGAIFMAYRAGEASITGEDRFSAFAFHPDDIGLIVAIVIPIAWYLALHKRDSPLPLRVLNYLYPFATLAGILLTATRGAFLATLPGLIYMLLSIPRMTTRARLCVMAGLLIVPLAVLPRLDLSKQLNRFSSIGKSASSDKFSGRLDVWRAGVSEFERNVFVGVGGGGFQTATRTYVGPKTPQGNGIIAHNTPLEVLTETGMIGFIIFAIMLGIVFWTLRRQEPLSRAAWTACFLNWAIGVCTLSFEFRWQTWIILAFAVIGANCQEAPVKLPARRRSYSSVPYAYSEPSGAAG